MSEKVKEKQNSSLVESLLQNVDVAFKDLLGVHEPVSLAGQILWIIFCSFLHPLLLKLCFLCVAVIVNHLNIINQTNSYKLWKV